MTGPSVSVILPTYNRAHLLERSIKSVLGQTCEDLELIVVDDGSTDNTREVVEGLSDGRVRYVNSGRNKGAPFARNTGIREAAGRYIAFQDSDDEWAREKLEKQTELLECSAGHVGLVYSGYWMTRGVKKKLMPPSSIHPKNGDLHDLLFAGNFITTQTALVRTECFVEGGMFDERLPRLQEWELWLRISKQYQFKFIDEPLVTTYLQPDSITSDPQKLVEAFEMILQKHDEEFRRHTKALAHVYCLVGSQLLCSEQAIGARERYLREAFKLNPMKARHLLLASTTFLSEAWQARIRSLCRRIRGLPGR